MHAYLVNTAPQQWRDQSWHDHDRPHPIGAARKGDDPVGMSTPRAQGHKGVLAEGEELSSNTLNTPFQRLSMTLDCGLV
jgi:hypothetical protein